MTPDSPLNDRIQAFLAGSPFAVVGASTNRAKYGNKVLRAYLQNDRAVYPINPRPRAPRKPHPPRNPSEQEALATGSRPRPTIEGVPAYPDLASLPETPHGLSIITPPTITEQIMTQAVALGIRHAWMQPGAENERAVAIGVEAGMNVIAGDACVLVVMGYQDQAPGSYPRATGPGR